MRFMLLMHTYFLSIILGKNAHFNILSYLCENACSEFLFYFLRIITKILKFEEFWNLRSCFHIDIGKITVLP